MPDEQLKIEVVGIIGKCGVYSRFEADDTLSILKMHRMGLVTKSLPIKSSLQRDSTVFGVKFETIQLLSNWVIPDLDFFNLSLRLAQLY